MRWSVVLGAVVGLLVGACGSDHSTPHICAEPPTLPQPRPVADVVAGLDGLGFDDFVAVSHAELLLRSPQQITELDLAAELGVRHNYLDDLSAAAQDYNYELVDAILAGLREYDRGALTAAQQLTYDVYEHELAMRSEERGFRHYIYAVTSFLGSIQNALPLFLRDVHPMRTVEDARDYVDRLRQVGRQIDQVVAQLQANSDAGITPPRVLLDRALNQLAPLVSLADARSSPLYTSFDTKLAALTQVSESERASLRNAAATAIDCHVTPGFERLDAAVRSARDSAPSAAGVGQFPGGDAYYAYALRRHTTTNLTADEIYQLGVDELARIHTDMRSRFDALGYPADEDLATSFTRVANDSGFVPGNEAVATYEDIIADAEANLAPAFVDGPPTDVIVIGGSSGGFYVPGTPDGTRPGAFYAQVTGPQARYAMATLAYHEAVPGHHLQISLAQQLDVPTARRATQFTAYVEGWALYAERLASELGWYDGDPYGDLGRLQAEAFRAARLVVDTGIHARGWSFSQAIDFMVDNTGYSRSFMTGQVARYMAWPGQATAYKIGMLHLLDLRQRAQTQLGAAFDLRAFHAAVLDNGDLPLEVLDTTVTAALGLSPN